MLNTVIKKIKNKKWLTVCLLLGLAFLVAAFCCQPMFKEGSMNMLLKNSFNNYIEENNQYPTVIGRSGAYSKENCSEISVAKDNIDSYIALWDEYLSEIDVSARQTIFEFESMQELTQKAKLSLKADKLCSAATIPTSLCAIVVG